MTHSVGNLTFAATLSTSNTCFVDLRATNASAGSPAWRNEADSPLGAFARHGSPTEVKNVMGSGIPGICFDGQNDYYIGPVTVPALEGHSARSVAVWALNPEISREETLVSWAHRGGVMGGNFMLGYGSDENWGAAAHWDMDLGWPPEKLPAAGQWHFFVYTYDGDRKVNLYVDGFLSLSKILSVPTQTYSGQSINIGTQRGADDDVPTLLFSGYINSVRIYGGVLSSKMIAAQYGQGPCGAPRTKDTPFPLASLNLLQSNLCYVDLRATNSSVGSAIWLNEADSSLGNFTRRGQAHGVDNVADTDIPGVYFDGASDWYAGPATVPALEGHSARSVAVWAFNPEIDPEETLVSWGHREGITGGNFVVGYGSNADWGAAAHWHIDLGWPAEELPGANEWHFFVYTYDGDRTVNIYVDGSLSLSTNYPESLQTYPGCTINIGMQRMANNDASMPFSGYINSVRIYGGVLSSQMIFDLAAQGPCCTTPLKTPWQNAKSAQMVTRYALTSAADSPERDPRDWQLLGSTNAGKTWEVLDRRQGEQFTSRRQRREFIPAGQGFFDIYRLQIDEVRQPDLTNGVQLAKIEPETLRQDYQFGSSLIIGQITAHGEDSPTQAAAQAFDGKSTAGWTDSTPLDDSRPSRWIQWQYKFLATNTVQLAKFARAPAGLEEWVHLQARVAGYDRSNRVLYLAEPTNYIQLTLSESCNFLSGGQRVLVEGIVQAGTNGLNLIRPKVTVLEEASPRQLKIEEPLPPGEDFFWAEMHGTLKRTCDLENRMTLELWDGKNRASLELDHGSVNQLPPANIEVRVRGYCTGLFNEKGERVAGVLKVLDTSDIKIDATDEDWLTLPPIPISLLNSTKGAFLAGRLVRTRGKVISQEPGSSLVIDDGTIEFQASYSDDGTNWTSMPDSTAVAVSSPFYIGLAVSSRNNGTLVQAVFDHVTGLSPGWKDIDIGEPGRAGSSTFDGKSFTVSGGGNDIWFNSDQFHFVYSRMEGDEIIARVVSLPQNEPWAKAGLMIRGSLAADAAYVDETVTPLSCLFEKRSHPRASCENMKIASLTGAPVWLKLIRSHPKQLLVATESATRFPLGTEIDVMGYLGFTDGEVILKSGVCRKTGNDFIDNGNTPLLTEAQQVRRLTHEELRMGRHALIRGVMTGHNYLQDATAGIYVFMDNHLEAGQFVEIEGSATPGGFGPTLLPSKITVLGRGKLPEPLRCSWDQLMTGREDSQWIEIVGRAQSITNQYLNVLTDGGMVQVAVENCSASLMNQWINTTLRIQGACAPFHVDGQVRGFVLRCPSPASVQNVHTQPENPFQIPSQPIKTVREYNALDRFFKIEGVVTYRDARSFFIQDATGGARVRDVVSSKMNVGDWVQVVGFPETSGYSPVLSEATTRLIGKTAKLQPLSITTAAIQSGNFDACLVRLEGIFLEQRTNSAGNQLLALETDDRVVEATLATDAGPLPALLKGSRLAVSGVCLNKSDHLLEDNQQVSSFDLFVSSSGQVVVLQQPAWWTLQRVMGAMAFLASGLFIALVWIRLLQRQVNERTRNLKLEIESHKRTESHLENEIEERKRIQIENEDIHKRLLIASRHAGMAEVAAGVLHHVGNIFNSINISANIIVEKLQRSKIGMIAKVSGLLKEHAGDLGTFLGQDEKGKKLPAYLEALGATIKAENHELQKEMDSLREHLKQVHQIVAMQEKYIHVTAVLETVPAGELAGDAIKLIALEFERQGVGLVRDWADTPAITVDKYKFMEILANLLSNALQACNASNRSNKRVVVKIFQVDSDKVKIVVSDNGIGILPKNLTRLFAFPTIRQSGGHGYGLHNSANAAKEMGGGLTARSDGPGQGSAFTVEMPIQAGARK